MKQFMMTFCAMILFGLVGEAHAETWWYKDRPAFMNHQDTFNCEINPSSVFNRCLLWGGGTERVLATDGHRTFTREEPLELSASCSDGICETRDGTFIGRSTHSFFFTLPVYYYIWGEEENTELPTVRLYKYGTGPAADDFPAYYVEEDRTQPAVTSDEVLAFFCEAGEVNQCMVRYTDMREAWVPAEEIMMMYEPVDPNDPEHQQLGVACLPTGGCDTMQGVVVGYDPTHPAFQ